MVNGIDLAAPRLKPLNSMSVSVRSLSPATQVQPPAMNAPGLCFRCGSSWVGIGMGMDDDDEGD